MFVVAVTAANFFEMSNFKLHQINIILIFIHQPSFLRVIRFRSTYFYSFSSLCMFCLQCHSRHSSTKQTIFVTGWLVRRFYVYVCCLLFFFLLLSVSLLFALISKMPEQFFFHKYPICDKTVQLCSSRKITDKSSPQRLDFTHAAFYLFTQHNPLTLLIIYSFQLSDSSLDISTAKNNADIHRFFQSFGKFSCSSFDWSFKKIRFFFQIQFWIFF